MRRRAFLTVAAVSVAVGAGVPVAFGQTASGTSATPASESVLPAGAQPAPVARELAQQFGLTVTMPDGANLNGIRWEELGGAQSRADLAFTVSYNVACQWVRAFAEGRQLTQARRVLVQLPQWPAFEGSDGAAGLEQAVQQALSGQPGAEWATIHDECFAARDREREYARQLGLAPTQ